MNSWSSYPKIYAVGHPATKELFLDEVLIEEKIDGSFIGFGLIDGELKIRSKGKELIVDCPEPMFSVAVTQIKERQHLLTEGYMYCGEYLQKPKHNSLAYDRVPNGNIMLFDVRTGLEQYMPYEEKQAEAARIGLECVPLLSRKQFNTSNELGELLNTISCLGSQKIEGFVVKNYSRFGEDKKVLLGKYVSEEFKEIHHKEWKKSNPTQGDVVIDLIDRYKTPARWNKAIQHLKERGELTHSPKDIASLMKETQKDVKEECQEEIKELLFKHFWPKINRAITAGLPEHYKKYLLDQAFDKN